MRKTSHVSFCCCKYCAQNCSKVYQYLSVSHFYSCIPLLQAQTLFSDKFLVSLPPVFPSTHSSKFLPSNLTDPFLSVYYLRFLITLPLPAILFCFSIIFLWKKGLSKLVNKHCHATPQVETFVSIFISPS